MKYGGPVYQAIKNRKVTLFAAALLVVFGLYSYYITPKQEAPDMSVPIAIITAAYPGASPEEVEEQVASRIEDEIARVEGYDYSVSTSSQDMAVVVLWLDQKAEVDRAWQDLREKMRDLQDELPAGCQQIQVNTDVVATAGIIISISGEGYSSRQLADYAERVKRELGQIDGISRFDILGEQEGEVKIEVDTARLNHYRLSLEDIANIIAAQNVEIPPGSLDDGKDRINVVTSGGYSSLDEIENTVVDLSPEKGSMVRLRDIADVYMDLEDSNYIIKHNGKNAVLLVGYFEEDRNTVITGKEVERALERVKGSLPEDIDLDRVIYQPEDIGRAVNNFAVNLLEGMVFVIIVVFLGMGIRNAVIVSTAIPLSVLVTFTVMRLLDIRIHQVSIAALIIALGMLVDNAIVISDSIQERLDRGQERLEACLEGVREVAIPVLTSTLTTIGAFIPLALLPSKAGQYIKSIPQVVSIALLSSYGVALLFIPALAHIFFKETKGSFRALPVKEFFGRLMKRGMSNKWLTVSTVSIALGISVFIALNLGMQFFPRADKDIIYINVRTEKNSGISSTEALVDQVCRILKEQDEVVSYTAAVGGGFPKFYHTMPLYTRSRDFGQVLVRVDLERGGRFSTNSQFVHLLQQELDGAVTGGTAIVKELEEGEPIGAPVRIRVTGEDPERLEQVAEEIKTRLSKMEGTVNVEDDHTDAEYQFYVDIDGEKAGSLGISRYDIHREISTALRGKEVSVFRRGGREYSIRVVSGIKTGEELGNLAVKSSITGRKVLLKEIAHISLRPGMPSIKKYDRERCITVLGDVQPGYSSVKIEEGLSRQLNELDLEGVEVVFDGERKKIRENFGDIGIYSVFAVLVVYGILLVQFGSFAQPFIILTTIPLSSIGSVLGLFALRQPLSFTGLLGIVSLFGIVVNNAIVLVDHINGERRRGASIEDACAGAVERRSRPIILSTVTTLMGLVPLALSGSELFTPMAISLMSGLAVSTLLTLVIIPVVYSIVEGRGLPYRGMDITAD